MSCLSHFGPGGVALRNSAVPDPPIVGKYAVQSSDLCDGLPLGTGPPNDPAQTDGRHQDQTHHQPEADGEPSASPGCGLPVVLLIIVVAVRAVLEERVLHDELPGYAAYMKQVRYRLIPYVW
jgi:hypothetical protein